MSDLNPRPACEDDLSVVASLLVQSGFRGWSATALSGLGQDESGGCWVIGPYGAPKAVALARWVADEAELLAVTVAPEGRRRGLARRLMRAVTEAAAWAGARRLFLEVRSRNAAARALYAGEGFDEVGRRPRFYGDDDAVLMARAIGQ